MYQRLDSPWLITQTTSNSDSVKTQFDCGHAGVIWAGTDPDLKDETATKCANNLPLTIIFWKILYAWIVLDI